MSNRVQAVARSTQGQATSFVADLRAQAMATSTEDWEAGGALADILMDLVRDRHISQEHYIAGQRLLLDMGRFHGSSGPLVMRYGDRVEGTEAQRLPVSRTASIDAFARMDRVLGQLREHERRLLMHLILAREVARGKLSDWGRTHSAFATEKTARAAAVGQVRSLLDTLVEVYRGMTGR